MQKNRNGDKYAFELVGPSTYKVVGELKYWRYGGTRNGVDMNNLRFADPSGGPLITLGMEIDGREITRIRMTENEEVFLGVANG